jgi:Ca2+-binding RTX toxin-like protein
MGRVRDDGSVGDGVITNADDCSLVGFDGTAGGVVIDVENGVFQVGNGPLPTVFNAADPSNPDVGDSDFAWSAIDGRVDSNGDETITWEECHFGLIGRTIDVALGDATDGPDILGNDGTNPCGFNPPPNTARNGFVDLNSDGRITFAADSCSNSCFFGHDVRAGRVQAECPGFSGDPRNDVTGTSGRDVLVGTARGDVICGFGRGDLLIGRGGRDVLLGGRGGDTLRGGLGADTLFGQRGNDRLFGGPANDFLNCGPGIDRGVGGPGRDLIVRCESRQQ